MRNRYVEVAEKLEQYRFMLAIPWLFWLSCCQGVCLEELDESETPEDRRLSRFCDVWCGRNLRTFHRHLLPTSSGRSPWNTSKTSANFYPTTRRDIPEDSNLQTRRDEDLKCQIETSQSRMPLPTGITNHTLRRATALYSWVADTFQLKVGIRRA